VGCLGWIEILTGFKSDLPIVSVCRDEGPWNENCFIQFMGGRSGPFGTGF
jgi:hypothetical protein